MRRGMDMKGNAIPVAFFDCFGKQFDVIEGVFILLYG